MDVLENLVGSKHLNYVYFNAIKYGNLSFGSLNAVCD